MLGAAAIASPGAAADDEGRSAYRATAERTAIADTGGARPPAESSAASAQETRDPMGKSRYTVFNPTPVELMRELSTDRPDRTESPYTVDAGHVQIETEPFSYTGNRDGSKRNRVEVDSFTLASINAKLGLTNRTDLQLVLDTYTSTRTKDRSDGSTTRQRGVGDLTARLKYNLFGNDEGPIAAALLPFLTFPTSEDDLGTDGIEGGLIVPVAMELPAGFGLGLMTEVDLLRNADSSGRHYDFIYSATINRELFGSLAGYIEIFNVDSKEEGVDSASTLDFGFTLGIGANAQFDAGVNLGLSEDADDVNPFVGFTRRF
jgi:hypothetical protein